MATIFRNEKLFCTCCGGSYTLNMPVAIDTLSKKVKAFEALHSDCPQTWVEPMPDMSQTIEYRATWWLQYGETGSSSKTMRNFFMTGHDLWKNFPLDADDFSRCYKLLQTVPEWRIRMVELKALNKPWSNLVDNWYNLTELFEAKKYKEVSELIDKLINK